MALIRMDHVPETVGVNLPLYVIVPDPGKMGSVPVRERKVLTLLHGLSDDASAWARYTSIEAIAQPYGLVIIMPSVSRSFYIDQPNGQLYYTYLADELPRYLESVFGLAPRQEDTLIAGVSMGGYGALKLALHHPERFSAAASFSGVLSLDILYGHLDERRKIEFGYLFGDLEKLAGSEHDPAVWLKSAAENPAALPRLFITCGRQDDLYPLNLQVQAACHSLGIPLDYHEEQGGHDWAFWDVQIRRFLATVLDKIPAG